MKALAPLSVAEAAPITRVPVPADGVSLGRFLVAAAALWALVATTAFLWPQHILLLASGIGLLLVVAKPGYGLLALLTTLQVEAFAAVPHLDFKKSIYPGDMVVLCLLASWAIRHLARRKHAYHGTYSDWLVVVFLAWAVVTLLWSTDPAQGRYEIFKLVLCLLSFFLTVALVRDRRTLRNIAVVMVFVGLVQTALCIVSLYADYTFDLKTAMLGDYDFINRMWRHRFFTKRGSSTSTAHNIGVLLCLPAMAALTLFITARTRRARVMSLITGLIITGGVISTMTKGAVGALWLGVMFVCGLLDKTKKMFFSCLIASVLVLTGLFLTVMAKDIYRATTSLQMQLDTSSEKTSAGSRLQWWKRGMEKLMATGGIGYGVGGYRSAVHTTGVPDGTHAAVLYDLGLPGGLMWFVLFINTFIACWRQLRRAADREQGTIMLGYLGGMITVVVSWLVTQYYTFMDLWIFLGLGYAIINVQRAEAAQPVLPGIEEGTTPFQVSLAPPTAAWSYPDHATPPAPNLAPRPATLPAWASPGGEDRHLAWRVPPDRARPRGGNVE